MMDYLKIIVQLGLRFAFVMVRYWNNLQEAIDIQFFYEKLSNVFHSCFLCQHL
jgi:hypothetical protein